MLEQELILRCTKGDRVAQKYLYDKYSPIMLGMIMRYVVKKDDAEDVLQEGFLKIFNNINSYEGKGSFEGWMKKIMINTAITHYHKNMKHNYHYDIDEIQETKMSDYTLGDSEFTKEELLKVIESLPHGYRMVFNLYAIEGYKHKEIAEMLKIDINTSKSQYSRAKKLIRKKLKELKKIRYGKQQ